jgi:hypothetical protein
VDHRFCHGCRRDVSSPNRLHQWHVFTDLDRDEYSV